MMTSVTLPAAIDTIMRIGLLRILLRVGNGGKAGGQQQTEQHTRHQSHGISSRRYLLLLLFDHLVGAQQDIFGGSSAPIALAVLRLITSSNLVGCLHRNVGRLGALQDAGRCKTPPWRNIVAR